MLSNVVSLISLLIALAAAGIAVWQVRASLRSTEATNALAPISDSMKEFGSGEFRASVSNILENAVVNTHSAGFDDLPAGIREDAYRVCYFFDYLGALAGHKIVGEEIIIGLMGTRAMQVWLVMESIIIGERGRRLKSYPQGTPTGFLIYYEHLVARIIELGGTEAARNLQRRAGIRRLSVRVSRATGSYDPTGADDGLEHATDQLARGCSAQQAGRSAPGGGSG